MYVDATAGAISGRPDGFVKKIAQNVAQAIFGKIIHTYTHKHNTSDKIRHF
jgi:hypothetical protein